ncbi:MAG: PadR family transcriptional regulator [Bacteroides sp.]|nr:PadR family transcriptional regulator [Clostridia bacterium]
MIPSQMLKGILEGCILAVISNKETYGYEISEKLKGYGFDDISEGTIYPLLQRLEKNGMVISKMQASDLGPKRKYYSLSDKGRDEVAHFFDNYSAMSEAVMKVFNDLIRQRL